MSRRPIRSTLVIAVIAALAAAPGASAKTRPAPRAKLVAFDSCRTLVDYAHANAKRAGGVGVPVRALGAVPEALARPAPVPANAPAGEDTASAVAAPSAPGATTFSGTNVQETGIDEPDVVKTDGTHVVVASDGRLRVIDVTGDAPRIVGTLDLGGNGAAHQLLLRGTRALVLSTVYAPGDFGPIGVAAPRQVAQIAPGTSKTVLTEVDLTDPAAPKVARTMDLDGEYVDARMVGGTVRVVVSSTPQPAGAVPLERAKLRTFVPATTIRSAISGRTFRRSVVGCGDVRRPDAFSGLGLLTVLTVNLDRGLYDVDRDAIMAGAQTVYGSDRSLYVASRRYVPGLADAADVPASMRTEIHRFDASQPGATTYAGSGTVPGFVLNQFALSEQDGALRVASTDEPAWLPEGREATPAQSFVTVLREQDGRLAQVGQVGGLGKGQRIYAVRFAGATGYVVTFRQIDPLYTLDLSAPAAPRVVGELEIPGYSAYLHPIGDGRLLGIGQEASADGRAQGTQVSLFDVSDLARPKRLQHVVYGNGSSGAEFDHHAFLWWPPTATAVLPLQTYDASGDPAKSFTGAIGLHVTAQTLAEVGRVTHGDDPDRAPIARSLVVGDRLYTLSYLGLAASRLDTLAPVAFVPFGP
ncbi:MAG TPA: beta-propeller domain-containing protein [Baekduia sp.]|uniref:beta-propeller domain-containing protein n=1 Tax=Baekduia sp. TaxID=2600305 RepID=UPI002CB2A9DA|nr:beta-propeller domain-containing protein [Baekduia sp.]HMJ35117.1 beta-propeller domain-containing protein [Baekduia sp.]